MPSKTISLEELDVYYQDDVPIEVSDPVTLKMDEWSEYIMNKKQDRMIRIQLDNPLYYNNNQTLAYHCNNCFMMRAL